MNVGEEVMGGEVEENLLVATGLNQLSSIIKHHARKPKILWQFAASISFSLEEWRPVRRLNT
jgi:hypothetical protein